MLIEYIEISIDFYRYFIETNNSHKCHHHKTMDYKSLTEHSHQPVGKEDAFFMHLREQRQDRQIGDVQEQPCRVALELLNPIQLTA